MDSEDSLTGTGPGLAMVFAGVAGTAVSDGVSDSAGGPAGDMAGRGLTTGIGGRTGSIPGGIGAIIVTTAIRQPTQPTIPTTTIPFILHRQKTIRTVRPPVRRQKIKVLHHPSVIQKLWTLSFSI
jgi:hypothetical protein